MNQFKPPLTPLSLPIFLLVILLATVIFNSASASGCFEHDSVLLENKTTKSPITNESDERDERDERDIAQTIKCLTEELESFEKINQELRVKVYELEQTVFEGFESSLPEHSKPKVKQFEATLPVAKISNKTNKINADTFSDSTEVMKASGKDSELNN